MVLHAPPPPGNRILRLLPSAERAMVEASAARETLEFKQPIYTLDAPVTDIYFLDSGVASMVRTMQDGAVVEIATIGNEGIVGIAAFLGAATTPGTVFIQIPGAGWRLPAPRLRELAVTGTRLFELLQLYTQALINQIAQNAACNRAHEIEQRCARWLLMTHDRAGADEFPLTQEFLAHMLGVRRAGVSAAASILQRAGFITYRRGSVTMVNRAGLESSACECYGVIRDDFDRLLPP